MITEQGQTALVLVSMRSWHSRDREDQTVSLLEAMSIPGHGVELELPARDVDDFGFGDVE